MKKTLLILFILSLTNLFSQSDTTFFRLGSTKFIVFTDTSISVKRRKEKYKGHLAAITIGVNSLNVEKKNNTMIMIAPEPQEGVELSESALELDQMRAWEFGFNVMEFNFGLYDNRVGVSIGLGFNFNNYRFKNNYRIYNTDKKVVSALDTVYNFRKSKMTISSVKIPLIFEYQSKKNKKDNSLFYINAGMFISYNMSQHMKYVYDKNGEKIKERDYETFHLHPFQYGVTARIGIGFLEIYAEYNISEMFKDNNDLKVNQFSVGVVLINF